MDSAKVNDWMQVVGIFAVVASLIFVGLQLQQDDRTARLELYGRAEEQARGFATLIADHADIWYRGCSGVEMTGEEKLVFIRLFDAYLTHIFVRWRRLQIEDVYSDNGQYLIDAYAANIHRYAGLRAVSEERAEWVAEGRRFSAVEWEKAVDERRAELRILDPNPEWNVEYCGT